MDFGLSVYSSVTTLSNRKTEKSREGGLDEDMEKGIKIGRVEGLEKVKYIARYLKSIGMSADHIINVGYRPIGIGVKLALV